MIEELQFMLDKLSGLDDIAIYILGGFVAYKLVIYLSTTGALVFLSKLLILKIHDAATTPKVINVNLDNIIFDQEDHKRITTVLRQYSKTSYVHSKDAVRVVDALKKGLKETQ